jgi:hypothetical protein
MTRSPAFFLLTLFFGCAGAELDSGTVPAECGDPDGADGTDTGNIPTVSGSWTSSFAAAYWDDNCTASGFDQTTETWIGAFKIEGAYPSFRGSFNSQEDVRFEVAVDARGGLTMTGEVEREPGTVYANFAGLVYSGTSGRDGIDGSAFLGLDVDDDQQIDCYARASWSANKSGL